MAVPQSGFFSYRQLDNKNDRLYLSKFRQNLEQEIGTLTGRRISIWQDIDDIQWGQNWKKAIDKGLADAAFFIPVITPGYLLSSGCRKEFLDFIAYEKTRKRSDLILPLIYVRPDELDDASSKKSDPIIRTVLERQYVDWEPLRHVGDERVEYREKLTQLGKRVRELLKTVSHPAKKSPSSRKPVTSKRRKSTALTVTAAPPGPEALVMTSAPRQRVLVVNRMGGTGVYQSVGTALQDAKGGELITVAPGHYREAVVLDKPVEIIGEGNPGDVTFEMTEDNVIQCSATFGRIKNVTLRQDGGKFFAVYVTTGSVELDGCEITCAGLSCLGITGDADARIRKCKIHGTTQSGIAFFPGARGVVEECDIYETGLSVVHIRGCMDVVVRGNRIHAGKQSGIVFKEASVGLAEDNEVFENVGAGIAVTGNANATIRLNRIYGNQSTGITFTESAAGFCRENKIFRNTLSGVEITLKANPNVYDNDIYDGNLNGIYLWGEGKGIIEGNRIRGNTGNGILVRENSHPEVRRNTISQNGKFGLSIGGAGGIFENNDLRGNKEGSKEVPTDPQDNLSLKGNVE
jgi:F-box protein 11